MMKLHLGSFTHLFWQSCKVWIELSRTAPDEQLYWPDINAQVESAQWGANWVGWGEVGFKEGGRGGLAVGITVGFSVVGSTVGLLVGFTVGLLAVGDPAVGAVGGALR
eukprot:CAMPEP_0175140840 /NCGR_PEP_ID=MMETSP0087-20121206/11745_1 /TAXON_ID=136419 /ORGANISM="Unknown Unknown, Strain D1" /LENGTH=107 /DNA_ID=CAMNT_0016424133 /DNA_START=608 /DNA_END=931 /DNA_ORIENTATION=+